MVVAVARRPWGPIPSSLRTQTLLWFRPSPVRRLLYNILCKSIQQMRGRQPQQLLRMQLLVSDRCPTGGICTPLTSAPNQSNRQKLTAQALHSLPSNGSAHSTAES